MINKGLENHSFIKSQKKIRFPRNTAFYSAVSATDYDRILIFKEPVSNKALEGHLIRTEKVSDEGNCRLKCYLEPNCVSVNVGPLDKGTHICELNNDTDESPSYLALVERQLYTYHAVEVWLDDTELISFAMTRECLFLQGSLCLRALSVQ